MNPRTSLDHWNVFKTVIEQGSYQKAAEHLERSQSTVSYAVNKLQEQLGATLIEIRGRKAVLTPIGELLLEDGKAMVEGMLQIEGRARSLVKGHEIKVRLCIESCVPPRWLLDILASFKAHFPATLLDVDYMTLPALLDQFEHRAADLYLMSQRPAGALSDELGQLRMLCVAHPGHDLARLSRPITRKDLALSHVIKCESSSEPRHTEYQPDSFTSAVIWRFNRFEAVIEAIEAGLGYGWVPACMITTALANRALVPLNLAEGAQRSLQLQLVHQNRHGAGPATLHLAGLLKAAWTQPVTE